VDWIIAVRVRLASGADRYFLTWGDLGANHPWPGDIERAVLAAAGKWALGGKPVDASVCDSLQEASHERYFYESLILMQREIPSTMRRFDTWADRRSAAVLRGDEMYYCGRPKADKKTPADPSAAFGYVLDCFDKDGEDLVTDHELPALTAERLQELLGDPDIDRVMVRVSQVSGEVLAAIVADTDIAVDEQRFDYFVSPWAERGFRTPRGYFPPPRDLPPAFAEFQKVRPVGFSRPDAGDQTSD
jgi:hypothetical protein